MKSGELEFYRSLLAGHHSDLSRAGRVGAIIRECRPAEELIDGVWPGTVPPSEMYPLEFNSLKQCVVSAAPSVGVVEVHFACMTAFASCFRVSDDPYRVVTARHLAHGLLSSGAKLRCAPGALPDPLAGQTAYRAAQVRFEAEAGGQDEVIAIDAIEWAHDEWDLMLLRLAQPSLRPGLALAAPTTPTTPAPTGWICTLGYPLKAPADPKSGGFEVLFRGGLGVKRASPGLINDPNSGDSPGRFRHDATTLGGSSGGPVILLATGEVIGVHVCGGVPSSPNSAVYLPHALTEDCLRGYMTNDAILSARPANVWPGGNRPGNVHGRDVDKIRSNGQEYAEMTRPLLAAETGALPDRFDSRDRFYQPPIVRARASRTPSPAAKGEIGRQRDAFSCTGFALAAAINRLLRRHIRGGQPVPRVSPAMMYALAARHDEFLDDQPGGSSLRGALKGFFHFGACLETTAPYLGPDPDWHLTIKAAKEAREITLGSYFRLRPILPDYQMAVQQAGVVLVSAHLHKGWVAPKGDIPRRPGRLGAHAFIIVGYDRQGFIIQNSWGEDWSEWAGRPGMARWSYADWAENVIDAWVLTLAPPAPDAFDLQVRSDPSQPAGAPMPRGYARLRDVRRSALIGHCLQIERDGIRGAGRMAGGPATIRETTLYLGSSQGRRKYPALALIFHDAATGLDQVARLASHMIEPFKANRIYPMHIHYGADEMRSLLARMEDEGRLAMARAQGSGEDLSPYLVRRAMLVARPLMRMWIEGCRAALLPEGGLWQAMTQVGLEVAAPEAAAGAAPRLHLLGIGTGALVAGLAAPDLAARGFGTATTMASVAGWQLAGVAQPAGARCSSWQLDHGGGRDAALEGMDGDWCDLLAWLSGNEGPGPRHDSRAEWGPDLASAITDPRLLNAILRHMLGRTPDPARRFF